MFITLKYSHFRDRKQSEVWIDVCLHDLGPGVISSSPTLRHINVSLTRPTVDTFLFLDDIWRMVMCFSAVTALCDI